MNIHGPRNEPHVPPHLISRGQQSQAGGPVADQRAAQGGSVDGSAASEHTAAPELLRLTAQLRDLPEVRGDRIKEVMQRLADGEYLTKEAARKTAHAILER